MQNPSAIRKRPRATAASPSRELPWSFVLLAVICACVVAAGFFFAARQHFTSMEYGLKNSKLREQLQNLEAEKRRLLLAREVAHSPVAISKAARGLGMHERSTDVVIAVRTSTKPVVTQKDSTQAVAAIEVKKPETRAVHRIVMTEPSQPKSNGEVRS